MIILWIALGILGTIWLLVTVGIWYAHKDIAHLRRKPKRDVLKLMLIWPFTLSARKTWETFTDRERQREIREKADNQAFREHLYQSNPANFKTPRRKR